MRKKIGYIRSAKYGQVKDMPIMFGLQLDFYFNDSTGAGTTELMFNISDEVKDKEGADQIIADVTRRINGILKDANVNTVDQLIGKPVEVTIDFANVKSFRILTEVIPHENN